jgi:EAL domain-containing protein (putative c-di-GMP-specific phosphodiesterase class I)
MPTERAASDIVELIIDLARKRHIKVIAEGIEAASLAERLREMGCEYGQGYCFSPPLEAPAALQFLQKPAAAQRTAGAT